MVADTGVVLDVTTDPEPEGSAPLDKCCFQL